MAVTNNITLFSDTATEYFSATELAESTNTTHTGAVLNNRLNYKSYNSFAKTVSTICAGLAEFLATYGGIASGTMDVDTDLMTWTNYMQALTTDNKMANAVNAVTPLAVTTTTTNTKSTTGHTHSINLANSNGGGAIGTGASATNGFAGGNNAVANANNAVQLGTGTNNTANTMQFLDKQVLATNFSKLTPSTANGWTECNQDTTLNVEDGLYLIVFQTETISKPKIVAIIGNQIADIFVRENVLFSQSFLIVNISGGDFVVSDITTTGSTSSPFIFTKKETFTYWYKKLV